VPWWGLEVLDTTSVTPSLKRRAKPLAINTLSPDNPSFSEFDLF